MTNEPKIEMLRKIVTLENDICSKTYIVRFDGQTIATFTRAPLQRRLAVECARAVADAKHTEAHLIMDASERELFAAWIKTSEGEVA